MPYHQGIAAENKRRKARYLHLDFRLRNNIFVTKRDYYIYMNNWIRKVCLFIWICIYWYDYLLEYIKFYISWWNNPIIRMILQLFVFEIIYERKLVFGVDVFCNYIYEMTLVLGVNCTVLFTKPNLFFFFLLISYCWDLQFLIDVYYV